MTELSEPVKVCVRDFKRLAVQIGPNFTAKGAQAAKIWSSHRSLSIGYTFNAIKKFAGLSCNKGRECSYDSPIRNSAAQHQQVKKKVPVAVKACLGYTDAGGDCKHKVPKGEYFCPTCKVKKDRVVYCG